jgi:hypothetical protein
MLEMALASCHGGPVVDLTALLADLRDEGDELDALIGALPDYDWARQTPAEGWTVAHQVAHLAWTDDRALLSVTDADAFAAEITDAVRVSMSPQRWVEDGGCVGCRPHACGMSLTSACEPGTSPTG